MERPARSIMKSASRLSEETLMAIFSIALLSEPAVLPPLPNDPRLTLPQVCQVWRTLILNTPDFWKDIGFAPVTYHNTPHLLDNFDEWMRRSGGAHLSFNFGYHLRRSLPATGHATRIEQFLFGGGHIRIVDDIILPHSSRLTSLVCLLAREEIHSFLTLPPGTLGSVEFIDITMINDFTVRQSTFDLAECLTFKVFEGASSLTNATFHLLNGLHPLDLKLPWRQLFKLDLCSMAVSPDVCIQIMGLCRTLEDLSAQIKFSQYTALPSLMPKAPIVRAPALRRLHVRLLELSYGEPFFEQLILPSLTYLRLERQEQDDQERDIAIYIPLLQRFASSLKHLALYELPLIYPSGQGFILKPPKFIPTAHKDLEYLLWELHSLNSLRLPPGLYLPPYALEKLALGEMLPSLEALDIYPSSLDYALRLVSVMSSRKERAADIVRGSSMAQQHTPVAELTTLCLHLFPGEVGPFALNSGYNLSIGARPPQGIEVVIID